MSDARLPHYRGRARTFRRHEVNMVRHNAETKKEYEKGIKTQGITKYARAGKPIGVPDCKDLRIMQVGLVAACTLEEALYDVAEAPQGMENPQVMASLQEEVEVCLLDPETPTDALAYLDFAKERLQCFDPPTCILQVTSSTAT